MAIDWKRWTRRGKRAWPAITGAFGLAGPYISTYVPVLKDYMTTSVGFATPVWVLFSCGIGGMGLAVFATVAFIGKRRASARAAASDARAAIAESNATESGAEITRLRAEVERRDWLVKTYRFAGVDWPLTQNFWSMVPQTEAGAFRSGAASWSLLDSAIGDPLCRKCRREIWEYAKSGFCLDCQTPFKLGVTGNPPDAGAKQRLKLDVYFEARAEWWRRQHPNSDESQA